MATKFVVEVNHWHEVCSCASREEAEEQVKIVVGMLSWMAVADPSLSPEGLVRITEMGE